MSGRCFSAKNVRSRDQSSTPDQKVLVASPGPWLLTGGSGPLHCAPDTTPCGRGQTAGPRKLEFALVCGVPKQLLTKWKYRPGLGGEANPVTENLMNAPTSSSAGAEKLLSSVEAEISRLVEQKTRNPPAQIEADPESIKAAIARLTSNSIDGLEGLMSELQQLQAFLKGEVERVRGEIESALAGVNIIIETIAPWKTISVPTAAARAFRSGPAASAQSPR